MTIFYKEYRPRIFVVFCFISLMMAVIWGNLFFIHVVDDEYYAELLKSDMISKQRLKGNRGFIFDRNGNYLARNIKAYTFIVDTQQKYDRDKILDLFPKTFDKPRSHYEKILSKKSNGVVIEKDIPMAKCIDIVNTNINGLSKPYKTVRDYPYNELAAQVIGYTNKNYSGVTGVEKYFNKTLKGKDGQRTLVKSKSGYRYEDLYSEAELPMQGRDVTISLDMNLQCILQDELLQMVKEKDADSGNGVIVDPFTGEILAMASVPSINLNNYFEYNQSYHQNKAILDSYEPGSTYKIVALSAGLEEEIIQEEQIFNCEQGAYKFHDKLLTDHEPNDNLNVSQILMKSSNIGISKIAEVLNRDLVFQYARKFGFGNKTGIQLPGETRGLLNPLSTWNVTSGTYVSIGQEIMGSTLQTAMAYSVIANGGYLITPQILKSITDENNIIFSSTPKVIRKVISTNTATRILNILESVVDEGSGDKAKINGYKVAGKTGTSQTYENGKISKDRYYSSFAGIFPSNKPKYVCVAVVINPKKPGSHWGSETAAPLVGNVFKRIIKESNNFSPFKPKNFVGVQEI